MLDDLKMEFEKIRQAIADGDREAAIQMLSLRCTTGDPLHDSLILLETRLSNLQQSVIEGVISREDENIERNGISKGLLALVKSLESKADDPLETSAAATDLPKEHPSPVVGVLEKQSSPSGKFDSRKWVIAAGILFTVVAVWGIVTLASDHPSAPATRDLSLRLAVTPADLPIGSLGKARISVGKFTSESVSVPSDGVVVFRNTPVKSGGDSVKLTLPDLKYRHDILRLKGDAKDELAFQVRLKTNTFSGKVLQPDLKPAPGIELEIEGGLARATTDAGGNFSFLLPDWGASTVRLVMRRAGKVLVDKRLGLDASVFKELKTPH